MAQIFKVLFFLCILAIPLSADSVKLVLILHSYSGEYPWTKGQHDSFVREMQQSSFKIDIHTEHLDTKYLDFDGEYKEFFAEYLEKKYSKHQPSIIYVTDDNALSFLREYKNRLFQKIHIVFSGINDMSVATKVNNMEITGVFERKEPSYNIEIINEFAPDTTNIYFIGDDSNTYKNIERELILLMKKHPKYTAYFIANKNIKDVIQELKALAPSIIILTTIGKFQNDINKTMLLSDTLEQLTHPSKHIFMTMEDAYMHKGVIGGYVTSSYEQGKTAAGMVLDFFKGKPFEEIGFILESPNRYYFDRKELNSKNLLLPDFIEENAHIVNETVSVWEENIELIKITLLLLFLTIFCLLIFLVYLYRNKNHIIQQRSNEIEKQKEEFEAIFKTSKDGLAILDLQSNFLDFNDAYLELTGFTRKELLNTSCIEMTIPEDIEAAKEALKNVIEYGYITNFEKSCKKKNGTLLTINMSLSMMPDKKRMLISTKDISANKAIELQLLQAKEKAESLAKEQKNLLSLFDKSDSVLFKWKNNDTWDIDYVSLNVSKLLGYELAELTSGEVSYSSCIHPDDMPTVAQEVKDALEQKSDFFKHAPYRLLTKNNTVKWILDYTVTQKNSEGEITHFIGYLTDITEYKTLEENLKLLASTDSMTSLYNRRYFLQISESILDLAKRNKTDLSIMMLDIDKFKTINDTYGH
ncbi:MAG: ABC transporter substrate binding protein, partial [Campylobacterota bacterium]|nr:ABC transporter substrate binding protein [Campylobacterota bacterium]